MTIDLNQPPVTAAVVAGITALLIGLLTVLINWLVAERKVQADHALALSEKAWADYELRRDAYINIARQIDCLFAGGDPKGKPEFHRLARTARLVGSDQVVKALNALTESSKEGAKPDVLDQRYRSFFNAMRHDIRKLHAMPPTGTDLDENAFPIES